MANALTLQPAMAPGSDSVLAGTLGRVARLGEGFELTVAPEDEGWIPAHRLVGGGIEFERLVQLLSERHDPVGRRAAGSQFVVDYLRFTGPAIAAYVLERRVPDVGATNLVVRISGDGRPVAFGIAEPRFAALQSDPAAVGASFTAVDDSALLAWLFDRVIDDHVARLVDRIRDRLSTSGTALWGDVASAFVDPLLWRVQPLAIDPTAVVREAEAVLCRPAERPLGSHIRLLPVIQGGTAWTVPARRTCCLAWNMPGGTKCAGCPLAREPVASESLRAKLAESIQRAAAGIESGIGTASPQDVELIA